MVDKQTLIESLLDEYHGDFSLLQADIERAKSKRVPAKPVVDRSGAPVVVDVSELTKTYKLGKTKVEALHGVSLKIYEGEMVALIGASGSGKSTLLQMIGGLDQPTGGTVSVDGQDLKKMRDGALSRYRGQKIGFVFQSFYLQPFLNVRDNIEIPAIFARTKRPVRHAKAKEIAAAVGLEDRLKHFGKELSGGQIQRTAIARALINQPKILLADEPTGNLDQANAQAIVELFTKARDEFGTTVIVVTHDEGPSSTYGPLDQVGGRAGGRMITLRDSLQLAYTKIRTRRIRLFIVLFVSSLLFSGLVAGSLVVSGALQSFRSFSDEGFSGRYIVAGMYQDSAAFSNNGIYNDPAMIARAEALEKDLEARKKAEAKRLGIEYVTNEMDKAVYDDGNGNKSFNFTSSIGQQVIAEFDAANPKKLDSKRFKQQVNGADEYYRSLRIGSNPPEKAALNVIKDSKEQTDKNGSMYGNTPGMTKGIEGLASDWTLMDKQLLQPFVLQGQTLNMGADGSIPIIASYSAAQEILKLPALGVNASAQDKKQRLVEVRQKIAGQTFSMCYRNSTSQIALQEAVQQQADLKANASKKDYQKPAYITAPSTQACAAPTIQRDARTSLEKQLINKQAEFERTFGKKDPVAQVLTYRIVGLSPDREFPSGFSVNDILASILTSSLGAGWASPIEVYEKVPVTQDIFKNSPSDAFYSPQQYYFAEFSDAEKARTALKEDTCTVLFPGSTLQPGQVSCSRDGRAFALQTYGSASLAIDEFQAGFRKVQLIAAGVIGIIAAVILMGMIGRIIADARKETAVFRALGASRFSISQIYIVYTLYLGILTVLISLIIGFGIALFADSKLSSDASITMSLLFNSADLSKQFHFYGLDLIDVGIISAAIIGAALVGSLIPIAHNVRRNPIKDMRED